MRRLPLGLVLAALLPAGCGGSDHTTSTVAEAGPVEELEAAVEVAAQEQVITDTTTRLAEADDAGDLEKAKGDLKEAGRLAEQAASALDPSRAERLLDRAGQSLSRASDELRQTATALGDASKQATADLQVGEDAQAQLADASEEIKRYSIRVEAAGKQISSSIFQLSQGLHELAQDENLDAADRQRLRKLRDGLKGLDSKAQAAVAQLGQTIDSQASRLRQRSVELTPEPPDVILDCVSSYETVGALSTRNLSCAEADPLVLQAIQALAPSFTVGAFSCSILGDYVPTDGGPILGASDIRCDSGEQAFRFSFAD
jgi:chromosome segregation ATPase